MFEYLSHHPEVSACKAKEPHFFTKKWDKGIDWYKTRFNEDAKLKFEGSTSYSNYPWFEETPKRIKKIIPGVKLIYIVRHPLDRLVSQVHHNMLMGRLTKKEVGRDDFWREGGARFIYLSMYQMQVEHYLKHFEKSQLHVLTLEELSANPALVLGDLARYLGIAPEFFNDRNSYEKHNVSQVRKGIKPGFYNRGLRYIGNRGIFKSDSAGYGEQLRKPELSEESISYIWSIIGEDQRKFAEFMGRDMGYVEGSKSISESRL